MKSVRITEEIKKTMFEERFRSLKRGVVKSKTLVFLEYVKKGVKRYEVGNPLDNNLIVGTVRVHIPPDLNREICNLMAEELKTGRNISFSRITSNLFLLGCNGGREE